MGNAFNGHDPNTVYIMQDGCAGNLGYLFNGSFSTAMDPRLAPYLTQEEYSMTIMQCNQTLAKERQRSGCMCITAIVSIFVLVLVGACFSAIHSPEITECAARDSFALPLECADSFAGEPTAGGCCTWSCCSRYGNDECNRKSLSILTDEQTKQGADCECVSTGSGKSKTTSCSSIRIDGPLKVTPEKNAWAAGIAGLAFVGIYLCCAGNFCQSVWVACGLRNALGANFGAWRNKGLNCDYFAGGKHSKARIVVYLPAGGQQPLVQGMAQSPQQLRSMQATVPEWATAGSTLQVQVPTGETLQVQVPPGVPPGGVFQFQY